MSDFKPRHFAIVPAAGSGSRMASERPKQYLDLLGRPLIRHALEVFCESPLIEKVFVVLSVGDIEWNRYDWRELGPKLEPLFCGGPTRADSVLNGLRTISDRVAHSDWVLVHDAARCLLRPEWVDALIDACAGDAVGGLLAQPLADTLKQAGAGGRVAATVDRSGKWAAQTPQMFRLGLLRRALAAAGPGVTDEAAAVESLGLAPRLVAAPLENFKLTWPEDFELAERLLRARERLAKASQPEAAAATISAACREGTR
ncbi:MAG: 2-C-methyl-D-erythritol 4-phosphate cytidylyltransferase [Rhodoferax sp.]|nr:2-C-methyl-D-erythritol 4-phosphate cytidylyltransferase [Rhodoferax sp.]